MTLVWRMTKALCGTGNMVINYSGFSVLKGLVVMYDR